eukprot:3417347-Prymnesium_polylepis.1
MRRLACSGLQVRAAGASDAVVASARRGVPAGHGSEVRAAVGLRKGGSAGGAAVARYRAKCPSSR